MRKCTYALRALRRGVRAHGFRSSLGLLTARATHSKAARTDRGRTPPTLPVPQSSMYTRNISVAALVSALASGLWYYQRDYSHDARTMVSNNGSLSPARSQSPVSLIRAASSLSAEGASSVSAASVNLGTESALDQLQTALEETRIPIFDEDFYIDEIANGAILTKQTLDDGPKVMKGLTPRQATQKLRQHEQSFNNARGKGVTRYDLVQLASNNPIEDDHSEKIVQVFDNGNEGSTEGNDWMFWGVFDGHSGWTTSAKLRQVLIAYVSRELSALRASSGRSSSASTATSVSPQPAPHAIEDAIKRGFVRLDYDIVNASVKSLLDNKSKMPATEVLAPALSGACALLSYYDSSSGLLRVACTGDSRAVLGRRGASGKWTATALSEDQTGGTPSEMARLRAEHPGEPDVVSRGRILGGLEPSRAFGDATYKWSRSVQELVKKHFFGRSVPARLLSPPYVTAEPIVTTTKIEPGLGDFVVLATDGLWEMLSNEEVVGLVGQWIEKRKSLESGQSAWSWAKSMAGVKKGLPVERIGHGQVDGEQGQRAPIRQDQWSVTSDDNRFVVEDDNVATHLVRNALGGKDQDLLCSLLSLVSPYSRRYRDDLTVQVIFFGDGPSGGNVTVNQKATNPNLGVQSKL